MREKNVSGHPVNPLPTDLFTSLLILSDFLLFGIQGQGDCVTRHTGLCLWQACKRLCLYELVARGAGQAKLDCMLFVVKRDRLENALPS